MVLEFVPETVYRASRHYAKLKQVMPMLQVKLYMYQVSDLGFHVQDNVTDLFARALSSFSFSDR